MSAPGLLLIVVAFGFLYFILVRPQKRRQLESQRLMSSLAVGDEVVTAGGVYGRITELADDAVLVEIAPQVTVKVARRAIGAVIPPAGPEDEDDAPADETDDSPAVDNGG